MSAPAAVAAIIARVTELGMTPRAVTQITNRFTELLSAEAATPSGAAATDAVSGETSFLTPATMPSRTVGVLDAPVVTPAIAFSVTAVPGTMPVGVWVDRIPNARGKALAPAIAAAAERYGLEPAFLAAVFWTESAYTPDVVSRTGAIGLGQLMPETAEWLGVDPWDPMQNIDGSARLYRYFLDKNQGDIQLAIASYAAGPGAVKRAGGVPDQFTANYITKLLARTDYLAGRRPSPP